MATPWYVKRKPPIFCSPCRAAYETVFPVKLWTVIIGVFLWSVGFVMLLGVILACIATACGWVAAGLCPASIVLLFAGYGLFHCGWAAHLLDEEGDPEHANRSPGYKEMQLEAHFAETEPLHVSHDVHGQDESFWQFTERPAWQAVSTRDTLQ